MKTILTCSLVLLGLAALASGCAEDSSDAVGEQSADSTSTAANKAALAFLQSHRVKTLWHCKKGWGDEAVVMFEVDSSAAGTFSGHEILAVQDPDICRALNVTCPYVSSARPWSADTPNATFAYASTRGRYEDGVLFFSDGAGMKLVALESGRGAAPRWDENWYFQQGECIKD